ncbi:MAG: TIGR02281 family clan AA aspartic protease [Pseudomonadota bacterium]
MRLTFLASLLLSCFTGFASNIASAADVGVVGLFPGKALLVIDGGNPKTYAVGSTIASGIKLVAADDSTATIEIGGKRQVLTIGQTVSRSIPTGAATVTLRADGRGHFSADGQINGGNMHFLVDTGATLIAFSAADATRLGINYKKGSLGYVSTANGTAPAYKVVLNTIKIGDIELNQVEALVQEAGLPFALLGMSFLNRTDMRREGDLMVLTKRY